MQDASAPTRFRPRAPAFPPAERLDQGSRVQVLDSRAPDKSRTRSAHVLGRADFLPTELPSPAMPISAFHSIGSTIESVRGHGQLERRRRHIPARRGLRGVLVIGGQG